MNDANDHLNVITNNPKENMKENITVKEIAEANNLKPAEANAMVKILEHFGAATKTGIRKSASKGKGKRPSEYSIASSCTLNLSDEGVFSVDLPESEVYMAPETSEVTTEEDQHVSEEV